MNKSSFRGWKNVYDFTLQQTAKRKGFRTLTVLISLLLFGVVALVVILTAKPKEQTFEPVTEGGGTVAATVVSEVIREVFVYDESGLPVPDYQAALQQMDAKAFGGLTFHYDCTSEEDAAAKAAAADDAVAVIIRAQDTGNPELTFSVRAAIPEGFANAAKAAAAELVYAISDCFNANRLENLGLSKVQLADLERGIAVGTYQLGDGESTAAALIRMFAPMLFGLLLYFMLLFYGQTICKEVSLEKTSKLVETLLISVRPYGLLAGKVLAVSVTALGQFFVWVLSAVLGLFAGNAVAGTMYPGYTNSIVSIVGFLRDNIGETALSVPSVILAVIIFCFGFLFFNVLAALAGCLTIRPEEAASTQTLFQFPVIIGWLVSYFGFLIDNKTLITVCRYIPFTAPFGMPVELLTGSASIVQGLISAVLLIVFSMAIIWVSARIYKGLVLYQGEKIRPSTIVKVLKSK